MPSAFGNHRYWRLFFQATGGNAYGIAEAQFRTTAGTPLLFSGGTATASSTFGSIPGTNDPSKVADNNPATVWSTNFANGYGEWWAYDYGVGVTIQIVEVSITARNDGSYTQAPTQFALEYSDDNSTWVGIFPPFTATWAQGQTKVFTVPANAIAGTQMSVTQAAVEQFVPIVPPQMQLTQAAVEHWFPASTTTRGQATQIALEQWSVGNPLAQATLIAVEEWASVALSTISAGAGEADAAATVTGIGVALTPPGVGAGEVDAGATVTGAGATLQVSVGTGEADAAATVTGAGFVGAIGAGEADAYADVRGMGVIIAPPNSLPFLPGLGWSVHRRPTFDTIVAPHASGAEVRLALWQNALWEFELSYDALASNAAYPGAGTNSLQTLMGFYLARGGQRGTFLYVDPDFNTMTGQVIGIGDGATLAFPFIRAFGGQVEPVSYVTAVTQVYLDGMTAGGWTASSSTLTFTAAPASGAQVSADFRYGFVCRFLEDELDFEAFMDNLWQLKSFKFRQVRQ
jgi:uncharacterized protein (TIGR02217 family)